MKKIFVNKNHKEYPFGDKFQIRWNEPMGLPECPYLYRWTLILFGRSIRLHHWLRSDDRRFFHDHSADLFSIVLKGSYWNVNPIDEIKNPIVDEKDAIKTGNDEYTTINKEYHFVEGIFNSWRTFIHMNNSMWFSKATKKHFLSIPEGGAWTLLLEGKKYHKWGFYVNGHKWRPLRYFSKYGIIQTKDYQ